MRSGSGLHFVLIKVCYGQEMVVRPTRHETEWPHLSRFPTQLRHQVIPSHDQMTRVRTQPALRRLGCAVD